MTNNTKKRMLTVMKDVAVYDAYFLKAYQACFEMSSKEFDVLVASLQSDAETLRLLANAHDTFKYGSPKAIEQTRERLRRLFERSIKKAHASAASAA